MGIKERRSVEKIEMKRKIIDSAIELIKQEGYEKLSIRKIAARIEYSPTTIYLYYKDKAEIITDMSNNLYNKVFDDVVTILDEKKQLSLDERICDLMRTLIKGLCNEPETVKAIMASGMNFIFTNDSPGSKPANSGIDMLDALLFRGIIENNNHPNVENTSWMIVSALLGFVISSIASQLYLLDEFDQFVDDFVKIIMEGIKK